MADVAQLVRALVCGTRCREFESHLPPHKKTPLIAEFFCILTRFLYLNVSFVQQKPPLNKDYPLSQPKTVLYFLCSKKTTI